MDDEITKPDHPLVTLNGDRWATDGKRVALLGWCISHLGAPYGWGCSGPEQFDCSNFVVKGLEFIGIHVPWIATHASADMFRDPSLVPVAEPQVCDLVFYAGVRPGAPIEHVMFYAGEGRVIGACGGGRHTLTVEDAIRDNAKVRFRPSLHYRKTFMGFRRLPLPPEADSKE